MTIKRLAMFGTTNNEHFSSFVNDFLLLALIN